MTLKLEQLVELKDQYSNVYPLSPTGARGWVRGRRELPKTDPEVYIEWDKSHWRYHGERDGWTFEHHFQPVDDTIESEPVRTSVTPVSKDEFEDELIRELIAQAKTRMDSECCEHCGGIHNNQDEFLTTLSRAQEAALGSDGYFIVTLTPQRKGDRVIYEPEIYTSALTDIAQKMIEAQVVHVAGQLFEQRMLKQITDLGKDGR